MHVPFFDLRVLRDELHAELIESVERVFRHGKLMLGPEVEEFERNVAKAVGTNYAVGVASGSSALYLALKSSGIGPGDEVITTPLTWIITLNAIAACGATPVCIDIREDFNIDPDQIEPAITNSTKAIVPVHFTGQMCEMDRICGIAERNNLLIIEDAAQAYGGEYKSQKAGSFSKAAAFSMNSMKVLGGYGEAGAVTTNDPEIYETVKMLRYAGTKSDPAKKITNECFYVSLNHKIDTLQAALLLVMIKHLPMRMKRRTEIAKRYNEALSDLVVCPKFQAGNIHALYTYAIQADNRDQLQEHLHNNLIETKIYHVPLACDAPVYADKRRRDNPVARKVLNRFLSIPAHEKMSDEQVEHVINTIRVFYRKGGK